MAGSRRIINPSFSHDDHQQSSTPSSTGKEFSRTETSAVASSHAHDMTFPQREPAHSSRLFGASWMQQRDHAPDHIEVMDSARGAQYTYSTIDRVLPQLQVAQSYLAQRHQQTGPFLDMASTTWQRPEVHRLGYSYPSGNENAAAEPSDWASSQAIQQPGPREWTEQNTARQCATLGLHSEQLPAPCYPPSSISGDDEGSRQFEPHYSFSTNQIPNRSFLGRDERERPNDPGPHAHTAVSRTAAWPTPEGPALTSAPYAVLSSRPLGGTPRHTPDRHPSQLAAAERLPGFGQPSLPSIAPRADAEVSTFLPSWRPPALAERPLTRTYVLQDACRWPMYVQTSNSNEARYEGIDAEEEKFPCDKCEKRFRQKPDLSRHKVSVHEAEGQLYKCIYVPIADSKCQGIFKRRDNLRDHLKRKHRIEDNDEMKRLLENGKIQGGTPESRLSEGPSETSQSSATGGRST